MRARAVYFCDCVGWNPRDVDAGLVPMIRTNRRVSFRTFCLRTDPESRGEVFRALGYRRGKGELKIQDDFCVSFHRSTLHGARVYYVRHSAIEYVFTFGPVGNPTP